MNFTTFNDKTIENIANGSFVGSYIRGLQDRLNSSGKFMHVFKPLGKQRDEMDRRKRIASRDSSLLYD